ncbi:MAG: murein biosynthesis integral membrane protein MurJ [Anaerolineales bacterium]|nr:murein biosynthesis integral membrane protein MurJ [Anaerolineales bacterium]
MKHIARSTLIIAVFFGLEKILGFVRNILISRTFGRSDALDAFNAANNIPDLLFALISGGALAMALIPVLSEYLQGKGRPEAWDLFARITNLVFLVTAGFSILIALFAGPLVRWNIGIAPGFGPEQQALVADLMRLNLIATLLFSLAGLAIAGLQANQHFLLPALAPSMYDLGALVGILILVPEKGLELGPVTLPALGLGIHGLVYGTILGALLFLLVQVPGLLHFGFRWAPRLNLRHPGVQQVLAVMLPRVATVLFIQLIFIAQDNIASRLVAGSVTALVYGWLFMQVPESLIGTALGTALLPTLSEQITRQDEAGFQRTINHTLRAILALTIPLATILIIGIHPLVPILGFDEIGTGLVTWTTRAYMLGIIGHSLIEVGARAFYARQDARTPLALIGITFLLFILFAIPLALVLDLGAPGIALANSLAFSIEAGLFLWLLRRRYPGLLALGSTPWRVALAALAGGLLVFLGLQWLPLASLGLVTGVLASIALLGAGVLVTLPFIWPELRLLLDL